LKKIIKKILQGLIYIVFNIFSPKLFCWINLRFNQFYSMWKANEFKQVGSVSIQYPMYLKGGEYIKIGQRFDCDHRLRLDAIDEFLGDKFFPEIIIGDNVSIQKDCHIGAINKIIIGHNVLLASKVYISDHFHGEISRESCFLPPAERKLYSKGPVIIGDNVWLGEGVVVLPGVTIGENCIVGANAVVTNSIPKNSIAGGNPARVIRELI
jgi:acetyltransferase-like isoleucine patch superfamily enzyme